MAKTWESYGPKLRQVLLNPDTVEVDAQGFLPQVFPGMREMEGQSSNAVARRRGWGTVHWDLYGPLLQFLEVHLNPTTRDDETAIRIRENNLRLGPVFPRRLRVRPGRGAQPGGDPQGRPLPLSGACNWV